MNMYTKQKRLGPRLERRNAIKNIDYDASTSSSSSSSFDNQSAHRTRSLDISALSDKTSFRIEGIEGEFDLICRSLGLSGPEDFAIPAAAWEAHKAYSPTGGSYLPSAMFRYSPTNLSKESPASNLLGSSESKIRVSDGGIERDTECLRSGKADGARVLVRNGVKKRDEDASRSGINEINRVNESPELSDGVCLAHAEKARVLEEDGDDDSYKVRERRGVEGSSGIKGVRPPLLAPPPVMSRVIVDNLGSSWDLIRGFAPLDNEDLASDVSGGLIRLSKEVEDIKPIVVKERTPSGMKTLRVSTVVPPSDSDTSDDEDDVTTNAATEHEHFVSPVSPNGSPRCSFKNWQKGDFLGSGSFGTVYEGFNENGLFFAVKEVSLLDQGNQGKQSIVQLEQEISLLSQFQHENIVRYLGTDSDDGKLYIFLELVTKGSLANLYQKYHLRDSQVSAYTRQILSGLNYLHERKVIHRDIKCANILVDVSGSVKLADFGLAKATQMNDIKSCRGTPYWMAPEVINNRKIKGYGLSADIWSLGCTVLEMLTRQIPYSHLEGMQAMFRIGRGEPPPISKTLSGEAQDFILKCLQVNPNNRPTAAQLLEHPFVKRPISMNLSPPSPHYGASSLLQS